MLMQHKATHNGQSLLSSPLGLMWCGCCKEAIIQPLTPSQLARVPVPRQPGQPSCQKTRNIKKTMTTIGQPGTLAEAKEKSGKSYKGWLGWLATAK